MKILPLLYQRQKKKDESIYFLVIGRRDFTRAYYPGARYTLFSSVSKLSWRKFYPGFFHIKVPGSKGFWDPQSVKLTGHFSVV